jgi:hypothetical protein
MLRCAWLGTEKALGGVFFRDCLIRIICLKYSLQDPDPEVGWHALAKKKNCKKVIRIRILPDDCVNASSGADQKGSPVDPLGRIVKRSNHQHNNANAITCQKKRNSCTSMLGQS